jgi:drug/metabolite transporter (DMT)-like permease
VAPQHRIITTLTPNLVAGLVWVGVTVLCWAPLFSVAKRILPHLDAFALATARYLFGAIVLVALLVAAEGWQALRFGGRFAPAAAFGLAGIAGFSLFVWIGLVFTLPEHAAVILALQSPLTALAVWITRGQRPAAFTLGCVLAAFSGVIIVATRGDPGQALQGGVLLGDVLVFVGGICWVIYGLAGAHFSGWSPLRITVLTSLPGLAGLMVANTIAIAAGWAAVPSLETLASVWWQIAYLSLLSVALGVLAFNNSVRRLGPLNTMLLLNVTPIIVFGIEAALGRSFAAIELAGAALVIAALVANNLYLRGASTRR